MYDPLILELTNQIAREGIKEETTAKLTSLADSLLYVGDYDSMNITNLQTMLLLLQDFEIKPVTKRLVDELRYRIIRQSLGENWQHGVVVSEYNMNDMNKELLESAYSVSVYQDGAISKRVDYSIQPLAPKDTLLLNDMGQLAFNL